MTALIAVLLGVLVAGGLILIVSAFLPQHARLSDALEHLADTSSDPAQTPGEGERGERLGAWWLRRRPAGVTPTVARALQLRGRSLERHYSLKVTGLLVGVLIPTVIGGAAALVTGAGPMVPLVASLAAGLVGFVLPDVSLRGRHAALADDATESLLTYFDLVTLERMANQSATQSLHAAADVSDNAVFAQVRTALERARLQQRMPFTELRALGTQLELPALVDLADVMKLDEAGAALSTVLRARVKELRDAHLTDMKVAANQVSERMTVFMVLPSLIFGAILIVPPILRLAIR